MLRSISLQNYKIIYKSVGTRINTSLEFKLLQPWQNKITGHDNNPKNLL